MNLSIVIPTFNRPQLLYRTLYSLWRQNYSGSYEILICIDDDEEFVSKTMLVCVEFLTKGMPIRMFETWQFKRGRGWGIETYPLNVGIRQAQYPIIMLNSSDVLSITNTMTQHVEYHEKNTDDKSMLFSTVHGLSQQTTQNIDSHDWKNNPASLLYNYSCEYMFCGEGKSYSTRFGTSGYEEALRPYHYQMSIKKSVLEHIRGFDEDFYGGIPGADDDLATRLDKYGCKFEYSSDAIAVHQWHPWGSKQSKNGFSETTTSTDVNPLNFWEKDRKFKPIIRNANHEWGQYPRDVKNLPIMSGCRDV